MQSMLNFSSFFFCFSSSFSTFPTSYHYHYCIHRLCYCWWLLLFYFIFIYFDLHTNPFCVLFFNCILPEMCVQLTHYTVRRYAFTRRKWRKQWIGYTYFNLFPLKCHFHTSFECMSEARDTEMWCVKFSPVTYLHVVGRENKPNCRRF